VSAVFVRARHHVLFGIEFDGHLSDRVTIDARRIDDRFIGAEFVDHDTYTDTNRILGFYLMPR